MKLGTKKVTVEDFGEEVQLTFDFVGDTIKGILKDASLNAAESTCRDVTNRSMSLFHSKRHAYARGWAVSATNDGYVVHNKRHYRLTHLLEHGHNVVNQWGATGKRAGAHPHIAPAELEGVQKFIDEVNQKLETEL